MKTLLIGLFAFVLLVELAAPQTEPVETPLVCSPTPPPLPKRTELDPNPARYALPESNLPLDPDYVLDATGAKITYTDVGQLYTHECPAGSKNAYWFEEDQWVKDPKLCWIRKPVKISECNS